MDEQRDEEQLSQLINTMNPAKLEMLLSLAGPGAPENLEEAVERIAAGKPVVPTTGDHADGPEP